MKRPKVGYTEPAYVLICKCRLCDERFIKADATGKPTLYSECNMAGIESGWLRQHDCKNGKIGFADVIGYDFLEHYNQEKDMWKVRRGHCVHSPRCNDESYKTCKYPHAREGCNKEK